MKNGLRVGVVLPLPRFLKLRPSIGEVSFSSKCRGAELEGTHRELAELGVDHVSPPWTSCGGASVVCHFFPALELQPSGHFCIHRGVGGLAAIADKLGWNVLGAAETPAPAACVFAHRFPKVSLFTGTLESPDFIGHI